VHAEALLRAPTVCTGAVGKKKERAFQAEGKSGMKECFALTASSSASE
jgi:hypothetical protein